MTAPQEREGKPAWGLFVDLGALSQEQSRLQWEGSFEEYVEKVRENPKLVRSAHRYILEAVTHRPDFFTTGDNALFGIEKATNNFVDILNAAAQGLEPRKRILLLMGPVGGGKSTLVSAVKRGIEAYSKTDEGAVYAIADCPMKEEPFHLIPEEMRLRFEERFGIRIEGNLCPHCEYEYVGNHTELKDVRVKRIVFSENRRIGIGTFSPSDPKSQDITELVGSVDFSKLGEYGVASDPKAYRFDGELNVANRGIVEFVEMLKVDEKFLYTLLSLAQERVIKTGRFANISADEVPIAHTNESEYLRFVSKKENEALKDRILVIPVPYNLRVSEEIKIYHKLIRQSDLMRRAEVHIAPNTLRVASIFAVLSRLEEPKKGRLTKMKKLKIYDGEKIDDITERDVKEIHDQHPREGMEGISPRYIIDCLSTSLIKEGRTCLSPIDALRALKDGLDAHPHTRELDEPKKEAIKNLIGDVRTEYDDLAKREVQSAFVHAYESSAQTVLDNYLTNVEAYCNKKKVKDPVTDEDVEPDEKLMRSVEDAIGITDAEKKEFRQEILMRVGSMAMRGEKFQYTSHPRLKEAIEGKLFNDLKDVVKITTSTKTPDVEQLKRINDVAKRLIDEKGYCTHCAQELLKYVGTLLNR